MADRMRDKTMWAAISAAVGMLFGALCFGLQHKSSGAALAAYAVSIHAIHIRFAKPY